MKKKPIRIGKNTIEALTLGEWMSIWFEINVLPWKDEYTSKVFTSQALEEIKGWFKK